MADFHQNGIITTLHNLSNRTVDDLENELVGFRQERPMAVILPSLFSELEGPALKNIIQQLSFVPYFLSPECGERLGFGITLVLTILATSYQNQYCHHPTIIL